MPLCLALTISLFTLPACADEIEVGDVEWQRDLDASYVESRDSGKPVLVLFQEVPGCAGCRQFGREVLSHPRIVEAIETEFTPVLIYNNRVGKDAETLKEFGEPAWNYQVVRFLDPDGKDIIPRKDKVWTVEALAARMIEVLETKGRDVPRYLTALAGPEVATNEATAAFAMFCFWTGETRLGGIDGVLTTEAGWLDGREVTKVTFDRDRLSFADLVVKAASYDCANKVFTTTDEDRKIAKKTRLETADLTDEYRAAKRSDQKKQIPGTLFEKLELTPIQATKVNSFARTDPQRALEWISPRQQISLKKS